MKTRETARAEQKRAALRIMEACSEFRGSTISEDVLLFTITEQLEAFGVSVQLHEKRCARAV